MPCVNQIDAFGNGIQKLVIGQIRSNKGVASGSNDRVNILAAGTAPKRHILHRAVPCIADAVCAQCFTHSSRKVRQLYRIL